MDYNEFSKKLISNVFKSEEIMKNSTGLTFHKKGEKAEKGNSAHDCFIRSTNLKYYKTESGILMGDFIELHISGKDEEKVNISRFNVKQLYDAFLDGGWEKVLEQVRDNISYAEHMDESINDIIEKMNCYEKIKDRLIIRPLNLKNNRSELGNYVYRRFGDIALVLYAVVLDDKENNSLNTVKIPKEIFESWGMDWDNVLLATLINTNLYAMPRLYRNFMEVAKEDNDSGAIMSPENTLDSLEPNSIPIVTTTRRTNGAVAMFYPGVKEKIAEIFDDSFYVAFTSIHEAMLHKAGSIEPHSIRYHLKATNKAFGDDEMLSENVYFYDKDNKTFTMVKM